MERAPLIHIEQLAKSYKAGEGEVRALRGVHVQVHTGEFVAVMGASGSGKSTLLHLLGLLDRPTSGSYIFEGVSVAEKTDAELAQLRGARIGFVFQAFHLLPGMSAVENVALPLLYAGVHPRERRARAVRALERVGLGHRLEHIPQQMSGGERQRVAIARALVNEPSVIFADEPTGNLDSKTGEEVLRLFSALHADGRTIMLITHEREAAAYAERILTMRDGTIMSDEKNQERRTAGFQK